ncbi:MAG: hypothetical protein AB1498_12150 [bacterium]
MKGIPFEANSKKYIAVQFLSVLKGKSFENNPNKDPHKYFLLSYEINNNKLITFQVPDTNFIKAINNKRLNGIHDGKIILSTNVQCTIEELIKFLTEIEINGKNINERDIIEFQKANY